MTSQIERKILPPKDSTSLVLSVCNTLVEIDQEIEAVRQYGLDTNIIRNLYKEKGYNMLLLLRARPISSVPLSFGLIRYPGETFHPFSQNRIELMIPEDIRGEENDQPRAVRCGVDLIAQGLNGNSQEVIENLLGDPYFIDEPVWETVNRTYEEIRESQRAYRFHSDMDDLSTMAYLDTLRLSLVEKILYFKNHPRFRGRLTVVSFRGQRERMVRISTHDGNYILLPQTPEVEGLVLKYGGFVRHEK